MNVLTKAADGCDVCPTRHACIASTVDEGALEDLTRCLVTSSPMQKGQFLYRMGDPADRCFVIRSGVYKTSMVAPSGDEYVTGFYYPGELMGLKGQARGCHSESALALTVSTACHIKFKRLPGLWSVGSLPALFRMIAEKEQADALHHINLSQSRADARIAGFLKLMMDRLLRLKFDPLSIPLPMSRTDMANYLGLTLESLSRVLSRWKKARIIDTERSKIVILKPAELDTLAYHIARVSAQSLGPMDDRLCI